MSVIEIEKPAVKRRTGFVNLKSSAPHMRGAGTELQATEDWGPHDLPIDGRSLNRGLLLWSGPGGLPEAGLWECTPGSWRLRLHEDQFCHFTRGKALYSRDNGEQTRIDAHTLVHFPAGWSGLVLVDKPLRCLFMTCLGAENDRTPSLRGPRGIGPLEDWGPVQAPIDGVSHTSGLLLSKGPNGVAESGIWECTPGRWRCEVTRDEFCHFLEGRCTYTHESGEVIEIVPDTAAFFPQGWRGQCVVHQTLRKVYFID